MMRGNRNLVLFFMQSGNYGWAALFIVAMTAMWLVGIYFDVWATNQFVAMDQQLTEASLTMDPDSHAYHLWAQGAYAYYIEQNPEMGPEQRLALAEQLGLDEIADTIREEEGLGGCSGSSSRSTVSVGLPLGLLSALIAVIVVVTRQMGGIPLLGSLIGTGGSPLKDPTPPGAGEPPQPVTPAATSPPEPQPPSTAPPPPRSQPPPSSSPPQRRLTLEEIQSTRAARSMARGPTLRSLTREDDGFSVAALLLFVHRLHRRMTSAAVTGRWEELAPYVVPGVRSTLEGYHDGVEQLAQLVLGGLDVEVAEASREWVRLDIRLQSTRFERVAGRGQRTLVVERWTLRRNAAAASADPEVLLAMGCPSCAVPVALDAEGCCSACGRNVSWGQFGWQVVELEYQVRRTLGQPPRRLMTPNPDHYTATSQIDPTLTVGLEALSRARPEFDPDRFFKRMGVAFTASQEALSTGQWQKARPYLADLALGELRVEIEEWKASERRLVRRDALLDDWELVRAHVDPWYALLVVRIKYSALEFVLDKDGLVAEGSDTERIGRSAYWTFARGTSMPETGATPTQCSSCANPLDRVSPEGVCGHCGADLASLEWDWMLLRTEGVDVFR